MSQENVLFIPKKVRVGFVKRKNTADGQLSYIIYFDEKNKLRKEVGFEKWRDKNIPIEDIDNDPVTGLKILTNIKRNPYGFGEAVERVRVYDTRGFEFEISLANYLFLTDHGNIINSEYTGKYVFSWTKSDLILLPINSLAYNENMEKLKLIDVKIKESDLIIGASYSLKKSKKEVIYLGKYYNVESLYLIENLNDLKNELSEYILKYSCMSLYYYKDMLKKKYIFLTRRTNSEGFIFERYSSLSSIEKLKNTNALSLEDIDKIKQIPFISEDPFEFKKEHEINKKDAVITYDIDNFEISVFSVSGSIYGTKRKGFLVFDKNKKLFINEKNFNEEINNIIESIEKETYSSNVKPYLKLFTFYDQELLLTN